MKIYRVRDAAGAERLASSPDGRVFTALEGDLLAGSLRSTGETVEPRALLAPLRPPVILAIGLNYRKHAEETGARLPQFPILFFKSPASVQDPGGPIVLPRTLRSDEVDYEVELAVVIGRRAKNVPRAQALDYVLGYTVGNDVSARDWQKQWGGSQWCRGKTFDTFCPLGPCLVTPDEIPDPGNLKVAARVNGETRQRSGTRDLIFDVAHLIEFLSGSSTLEPGTVILTGTPEGVGFRPPRYLKAGDVVEVEVEGIGVLRNPVVEEEIAA